MDRLFMTIATGFGAGYLPKAPGTWGSLLALPLHFFLSQLAPSHYALALGGIFFLGVITAGQAEKILDRKDPGVIVIDEVIGMLITLIGAPDNPLIWLLGFGIFRFFDIFKPYPIRIIDRRINGGMGIVLDDVLAGVYSCIVLQIFCYAIIG
ncbi:MAG: phosphatidylglycerophosphatase A [Proteobacteria bacterium]|nr:phosphatidylglycerophosphatase A [Pseudomonadota bacterium]MBU1545284.1 phosphatidylglycerophosphatase A [Pseudomonadota bacterium]MBU2620350.1 phosphatidylglycerophosphatase A [Pseudomonadota bacterium]